MDRPPAAAAAKTLSLCGGQTIYRHQFSTATVLSFIQLVLRGPVSQRAAASVLRLLADLPEEHDRVPCANSGRLWLARMGLYALTCEKPRADDWLWMIDHTVQLGPWKCLVIVGVRLSVWRSLERPLAHEDLCLLGLAPMKSATKEAVAEELRKVGARVGPPAAALSDEGAELKGGMEIFREDFPDECKPPHVHDIKHKAATLLKKELEAADDWPTFVKRITRSKQQLTLTDLAFLNPPRLRNKARFMNLEPVVRWGCRTLRFLEAPMDFPDEPIDKKKLEAKLGWLRDFKEPFDEWKELLAIIEATEKYVRREGYHAQARLELAALLEPLAKHECGRRLMNGLLEFVDKESSKLKETLRVAGHTEVLESLLGKYKQIQGRHSQGGMTASLLNIGAAVVAKTPEVVDRALTATPVKAVLEWVRNNLGLTVASKAKTALQSKTTMEQIPPENLLSCSASF
jgi:hypothetical protein